MRRSPRPARTRDRRRDDERGSVVVELALIFTLFFFLIAAVVQGAVIFSAWQIITNAVREGARFGAPCIERPVEPCFLTKDDGAGTPNVHDVVIQATTGIDRSRLSVAVTESGGYLIVSASYSVPIIAPFIETAMPSGSGIPISAESAMRIEHADFQ